LVFIPLSDTEEVEGHHTSSWLGCDPIIVHVNHGGADDAEDSDNATNQGSTSHGHEHPSNYGDVREGDERENNDNPPDSHPCNN
jgi:hypothetical protein